METFARSPEAVSDGLLASSSAIPRVRGVAMDASEPVLADSPRRLQLVAAKVKRPAMPRGGRHGFRVALARVAFACMAERAHPSVTA